VKKKGVLLSLFALVPIVAGASFYFHTRTNPQYALLVFGPQGQTRVWIVLEGETIYLDRSGGELPAHRGLYEEYSDGNQIRIQDPDGRTTCVIKGVHDLFVRDYPERRLMVDVDVEGPLEYQQYADLGTSVRPQDAPRAHFHGPLVVEPQKIYWKLPAGFALKRGDKASDLRVNIGTMDADRGCWVVVRTHTNVQNEDKALFREGVFPVVDIEFPPKTAERVPVKRRFPLNKFC
jgi:hypothetical protein